MYQRQVRVALLALSLLAACGGQEEGLDVSISVSSIIPAATDQIVVGLFNAPQNCEILRLSNPEARLYGVSLTSFPPSGADIGQIKMGAYQIAVYAFASGTLVGFGCDPVPVSIERGKRATRTVELREL